jgi:putative ABC transport system permease protein
MVVSQFALSSIFLVLGFVWLKQTRHIQSVDLGYDRTGVLAVPLSGETNIKLNLLKEQARNYADVVAVSASSGLPGQWRTRMNVRPGTQSENAGWTMYAYGVDYDFFDLLRMTILRGRPFSKTFNDTNSFIINQSAATLLGWEDPIGKPLNVGDKKGQIIGVVDKFYFDNVHYPLGPAVFFLEKANLNFFLVKAADPKNQAGLIEVLHKNWQTHAPHIPFEFVSLNDHFNDVYFDETRLASEIISGIGGFAVFLSCLGLLALASYSVRTRTKEIAVRKVLGATVSGILRLLGQDFLKFVILSDLIALPIAYFISSQILSSAYTVRTAIDAGILLLTALLTFSAAVAAVSAQTLRAARANPADSLRHE